MVPYQREVMSIYINLHTKNQANMTLITFLYLPSVQKEATAFMQLS